jgi:LacI family transcriptional regulator
VREAVRHLAGLGHRRIACLAGDVRASHYAERVNAFRAAVAELGLVTSPAMLRTGLLTYADGQQAAAELLGAGAPTDPTALLCTTDTLAIGALRGAANSGRRVPQDVAVVGYGNTEVTAYCQPTLTCVAQDKPAVGARAVRVLLRRVAQRAAGRRWRARVYRIPTRLVVRESTVGAAPGGRWEAGWESGKAAGRDEYVADGRAEGEYVGAGGGGAGDDGGKGGLPGG